MFKLTTPNLVACLSAVSLVLAGCEKRVSVVDPQEILSVSNINSRIKDLDFKYVTVEGQYAGNMCVDQTFVPGNPNAPRTAWFNLKDNTGSEITVKTLFRQADYTDNPDDINLGYKVFGLDPVELSGAEPSGKSLRFSGIISDGTLLVDPFKN